MRRLAATAAAVLLTFPACAPGNDRSHTYSGTIEAIEVDIVPEVAGRIQKRPVDQGDAVRTGDTIATIDPEQYRLALAETEGALEEARAQLSMAQAGYRKEEIRTAAREVDEARAQLVLAETRVARVEELTKEEVSTQDDLDMARRDLDVARARLSAAEARHALLAKGYRLEEIEQARGRVTRLEAERDRRRLDLGRTTIVSPIEGIVTEKLLEPGEYVQPGSPIVSVADLANLYTWVYPSVVALETIRLGDEVAVKVDAYPDRSFPGKVVYVSPEAEFTPKNVQTVEDRVQLVFGVKVAVANPDGVLKIGIPADVVLDRRDGP
jgi:HlyD family secretion protein